MVLLLLLPRALLLPRRHSEQSTKNPLMLHSKGNRVASSPSQLPSWMTITLSETQLHLLGQISVLERRPLLAKLLQDPFLLFSMEARNLLHRLNILLKLQMRPLSLMSV